MSFRSPLQWDVTPLRLAVAYLVVGFTGLFVSDVVLPAVVSGSLLRLLQSVKGAAEILLTAVFLYLVVWLSWRDLRIKERAMDEAPIGITIAEAGEEDNPLRFANERFRTLTGYEDSEVLGRDCRFLQGEETDPETRARMREAIDADRPVSVDVRNYRKNGEMFWNKVDIAPVRDDDGTVTHYVGFQTDITERKIREQRLTVLNRVLRHNYRNQMNVVEGYLSVLREEIGRDREAVTKIQRAVDETIGLVETAQRTEAILRTSTLDGQAIDLRDRLGGIVDDARERYPGASLSLSLPETAECATETPGICEAVREAIVNAVEHNDDPDPEVAVRVTVPRDGWLEIEIADNGPGIPEEEIRALHDGETPLRHGTHMGLWMIQWVVSRANGTFHVPESGPDGTRLVLTVPAATHPD